MIVFLITSQFFQNPDSFPTNRITSTTDVTDGTSNVTSYVYDDTGSRIIKKGRYGEVLYVNSNYTVRNNDLISSHIYAGNTRVATRLVARQESDGTYTDVLKGIYYYHGDHLGSSSVVTQTTGGFHEHLEYFPYGETWVQDKVSGGASTGLSDHELPYRYTAKEQDTETGLYYYGARYYDPQVGRWLTRDRIFGSLALYDYCYNNPIKYIDPDGNVPTVWGVASWLYDVNELRKAINAGEINMIVLHGTALAFDSITMLPCVPATGGAGLAIKALNQTKDVVAAATNAGKEYNKSNGNFTSTGIVFMESYTFSKVGSYGIGKAAQRFLCGGNGTYSRAFNCVASSPWEAKEFLNQRASEHAYSGATLFFNTIIVGSGTEIAGDTQRDLFIGDPSNSSTTPSSGSTNRSNGFCPGCEIDSITDSSGYFIPDCNTCGVEHGGGDSGTSTASSGISGTPATSSPSGTSSTGVGK